MRAVLLIVLLLAAAPAGAEIYRWVDEKGVVHYSDRPLNPAAKPVQLPELGTYSAAQPPPANPAESVPELPQPAAAAGPKLTITSPQPEETIHGAERSFTILVSVNPPLANGQGLIYYLDGAPQNKQPTPSTAWLMSAVERGTHAVSAAVVDADGKELSRAAPVTVHVHPPIVRSLNPAKPR